MKGKGKFHILFISLFIVTALSFSGVALAEDVQIAIRNIDTSKYPTASLSITVSGSEELQTNILKSEDFRLRENRRTISKFKAQPIMQTPEPVAVVLAIDTSGSMLGKPLEDAKSAARTFINQMRYQDKIAFVAFNSQPRILSGLTTDKDTLFGAIDGLRSQGETALYDGMAAAIDVLASSNITHKNIIVLSDGGDTMSTSSSNEVIRKAKSLGISVFGIGLQSSEYKPAALKEICEESGGTLLLTSDSGSLNALYLKIAKELHNQYRIIYTSNNPKTKNLNIELEVDALGSYGKTSTVVMNPNYKPVPKSQKARAINLPQLPISNISSSYVLIMVALLSFISVSLFVFVVLSIFLSKNRGMREQLKFYDAAWKVRRRGRLDEYESGEKSQVDKIREKLLIGVEYFARWRGFTELIQLKLEQAGLPLRPLEFIFFHFLFVLAVGLIGRLFINYILYVILLVILASALPVVFLSLLITRRRAKFHDQLPDTLTMIAGSIRAGYSFLQAISVAVEETLPPMSNEFRRVLAEARLGFPLEEALEKMADRVGEQNFYWTVMAINIQREVGGNLAEVLEILADTIRDRDRVKRQIKTLTAEGRLSAIILVLLPIFMIFMLSVLNPTYISELFTTSIGLLMILIGSILMLLGGLWLKKIVTIEV